MSITKQINLKAKSDQVAALLEILKDMAVKSKEEKGCVTYQLYQQTQNPADFCLIETWENSDDLAAHKETDHFKNFVLKAPDLIEEKSSVELTVH